MKFNIFSKGVIKLKKTASRLLCLLLLILVFVPVFSGCNKNKVLYELGEHTITEKEYVYLMGMFKKQLIVSINSSLPSNEKLTEESLTVENQNGVSYNSFLYQTYRESFEQSILTLLYSQLLFDEYGLELTEDERLTINSTAAAIVAYYGESTLKDYGFDGETLRSVYEKQFKENKVRQYILGENNSNITDEQIESYYQNNYLRYKMIIINTEYKLHKDSNGETSMVRLSEDEKKSQELLVKELRELLVNNNKSYNYVLLKDDLNLSYDELWEKYSDEKFYPSGEYRPSDPTDKELESSNVWSAAYQSKVGEVKAVTAKRYFKEGASIGGEGESITVKPGDYFEYGTIFVKRLALDKEPYNRTENNDFFPAGVLEGATANYVYFTTLMEHEKESSLSIDVSEKVVDITFENVLANELDYYYLHAEEQ